MERYPLCLILGVKAAGYVTVTCRDGGFRAPNSILGAFEFRWSKFVWEIEFRLGVERRGKFGGLCLQIGSSRERMH